MTTSDTVIADIPLAQFAAVIAALTEGFGLRAVLSVEGLEAARWAEADRRWSERLGHDPALLARYQMDLDAAYGRLFSHDQPAEGRKARLVGSGRGAVSAPASAMPAFMQERPQVVPSYATEDPGALQRAPVDRYASDDEGTRVGVMLASEYFPFQATGEPSSQRSAGPGSANLGVPFRAATGHAQPPDPPFTQSVPAHEDPAPEGQTRVALNLTTSALPFRDALLHDFDMGSGRIGEGAGSDGSTVAARGAEPPRDLELREVPWGRPTAPATPQPITQLPLSLEQHASLCLEIAVDPARADEALARYGVTAAEKAHADEHYRALIATDPEAGAQWNHAYAVYHAWFTQRPQP